MIAVVAPKDDYGVVPEAVFCDAAVSSTRPTCSSTKLTDAQVGVFYLASGFGRRFAADEKV